jgi:hypothetical protein
MPQSEAKDPRFSHKPCPECKSRSRHKSFCGMTALDFMVPGHDYCPGSPG